MYINHINKYDDAQAIQDALDAGTLANPYVAMTSAGTIDYNSLQPTPPAPSTMGVWSDDGQGTYTFQIIETDQSYWSDTYIGTINSIEYIGATDSAEIQLTPGADAGMWDVKIHQEEGSETTVETFEEGTDYMWNDSGYMVNSGDSDSALQVYWDGTDTFVFNSGSNQNPLSMTTINPEYPAGE